MARAPKKPAPAPYVPPTPEEQLQAVIRTLEARVASSDKSLAKFMEELIKDPQRAMEWSAGAFEAAADRDIAARGLELIRLWRERNPELTPDQLIAKVAEDALKLALREARYPSASTSSPSNWAKRCYASAAAELHENLTTWWRIS